MGKARPFLFRRIPIQFSSGADASSERLPHIVEALASMACRLFRRHSIHLLGMALRLLILSIVAYCPDCHALHGLRLLHLPPNGLLPCPFGLALLA